MRGTKILKYFSKGDGGSIFAHAQRQVIVKESMQDLEQSTANMFGKCQLVNEKGALKNR